MEEMLFDDRLERLECLSNDEETHRDDLHPAESAADTRIDIAGRLVEDGGQSDNDDPEERHADARLAISAQLLVSVEHGQDGGENED
jgi:hypothetical protein